MADALDIIHDFLELLRPDITKSQSDAGLRASGKSALSLYTKLPDSKTGQLIDGSGSFQFQDSPGRGPTKGEASNTPLHERIYEWLEYRKYGLSWGTDKERVKLSHAIANKIHQKGNFIHIKGKRTGVVRDVLTEGRLTLLREKIGKFYHRQVLQEYINTFKN